MTVQINYLCLSETGSSIFQSIKNTVKRICLPCMHPESPTASYRIRGFVSSFKSFICLLSPADHFFLLTLFLHPYFSSIISLRDPFSHFISLLFPFLTNAAHHRTGFLGACQTSLLCTTAIKLISETAPLTYFAMPVNI